MLTETELRIWIQHLTNNLTFNKIQNKGEEIYVHPDTTQSIHFPLIINPIKVPDNGRTSLDLGKKKTKL